MPPCMDHRRGGSVCPSPLSTSRNSDRGRGDTRSVDSSASIRSLDRDKGVNVQVLLRCRPLIEAEFKTNAIQVISCNDPKRQVTVFQSIASKQVDRTFTFDRVFGPSSQQRELYEQAIAPIVDEVLEGFNCTVFAYGQTGTGKTYTMEGGGSKTKDGELLVDAGVIPRAVHQIFDKLESQNVEYSVKVTFLELYNEEITDLLAPDCSKSTDDKPRKPIALMEDGKGGVILRGLEEEVVYSANALYNLLERGSAKRRSTETLLNKQSSRSHSIFSITIHIKEETPEGEELIKCGKLNLVDLAGSENIFRSGAKEGRAREAGEINKSLLTLGRVITSLVERLSHVPYRDSKLTRLLRDSLGGKTKTCIIATVSPSVHCLEETLSTLDYAHRAKNIKNKPEINQKMMKSALIKDLYTEIERLKQEVNVIREKSGMYLSCDRFVLEDVEKKVMTEKRGHMESEVEAKEKQLDELHELYNSQKLLSADLTAKLEMTQKKLEDSEEAANDIKEKYRQANCIIKEKEIIISNLLQSEKALVKRASELRAELESAKCDVAGLFSSIDRKDKIETGNQGLVKTFQSQLAQQLQILHNTVAISVSQQQHQLKQIEEEMQSVVAAKNEATEELRNRVESLKTIYGSGIKGLHDQTCALNENSVSTFGRLHSTVSMHASALEDLLIKSVSEADLVLRDLQSALSEKESKMAANAQQQREGIQRTLESTRVISKIIMDFFDTLENHASKLSDFVEESQTIHDKNLAELEKSYEECAGNEEKRNLEEIAELLANSTARKTKLVRTAVSSLRESAVDKAQELQKEMLNMQYATSDFQNQWNLYVKQAEEFYVENRESVAAGHCQMKEIFQECMGKTTDVGVQWKNVQDSLQQLEKNNVEAVDTIVKTGMHSNQLLLSEFTQAASSADAEVEIGNGRVLSSIDSSLKLDHEACENMKFTVAHWTSDTEKLQSSHQGTVEEINKQAEKLLEEYMEDQPTCTTPKRRTVPSVASVEDSRTACSNQGVETFPDTNSENISKRENIELNGEVKQLPPIWDCRVPLTAIN